MSEGISTTPTDVNTSSLKTSSALPPPKSNASPPEVSQSNGGVEGAVVGGKRPRRGEGTISDPSTISLHHTDFVWETMFLGEGDSAVDDTTPTSEERSTEATTFTTNKAFLEAYLASMLSKLEQVKVNPIRLAPASTSANEEIVAEPSFSSIPRPATATPHPNESTAWEEHYTRNLNQFFPYKNYLVKAFPDLERIIVSSIADANAVRSGEGEADSSNAEAVDVATSFAQLSPIIVMECGCGTGSALLPIIHFTTPATARFIAFDISPKAVEVFQQHPMVSEYLARPWGGAHVGDTPPSPKVDASAFMAFPYNISTRGANLDELFVQTHFLTLQQKQHLSIPPSSLAQSPWVPQSVDLLLLIFTLCAMESVGDMHLALRRLHYWVRPGTWAEGGSAAVWKGGKLLFRDYGMFDHNMFRFGSKSASAECNLAEGELFCKKADGTSQFFFDVNFTRALFEAAGFACLKLDYHCNTVKNRKTGVSMHKVFVNGEFGVLKQQ